MEWGLGFGHMEFTNGLAFCGFIYILSDYLSVGLGKRTGKRIIPWHLGFGWDLDRIFLPRGFCTGAAFKLPAMQYAYFNASVPFIS
jgi:hypothetical protein